MHLQISSGAASKKTEEQIWEQQRIVTQLKRNLRNAKKGLHSLDTEAEGLKPKYEPIDYEEELDFSLSTKSKATSQEKIWRSIILNEVQDKPFIIQMLYNCW